MTEAIFPAEWWKLSADEYKEAKMSLSALVAKDLDPGTKEVSKNVLFFED